MSREEQFAAAKAHCQALAAAEKEAAAALAAIPGVGSGSMGLTPDAVKFSHTYRHARGAHQLAFARLREANQFLTRHFKAELRAERRARGR